MLDAFKKNSQPKSQVKILGGQPPAIDPNQEKLVVIHTMPERFFAFIPEAQNTKKTGVLILAGGALLLIMIFIAAYMYFSGAFSQPENDTVINNIGQDIKADISNTGENNGNINPADSGPTKEAPAESVPGPETNGAVGSETDIGSLIDTGPGSDIINIPTSSPSDNFIPGTDAVAGGSSDATSTAADSTAIKAAADSDFDGLTDTEEALLGTNKDVGDSDGDGFGDLAELLDSYNPAGTGALLANPAIERYLGSKYNYMFYYPAVGEFSRIGGDDSIIIKADHDQFFQIIIQPNSGQETIEDWYKKQFEVDNIKSGQKVYKNGWRGVRSEDGLIVYLMPADGQNIFTLSYGLGVDTTLYYKNIFEMMIGSLETTAN